MMRQKLALCDAGQIGNIDIYRVLELLSMHPGGTRHETEAREADDLDAYVATFTDEEREELAAAEMAINIAILLHDAREERGLSQEAAARLAGLQQQAVSRLERPGARPQIDTIRKYLAALGYSIELHIIDMATGKAAFSLPLPPVQSKRTA